MKNLIYSIASALIFFNTSLAQDGKFTFTIKTASTTSAGVFKKDGTLVRALWNGVHYAPGTYSDVWDGKDDQKGTIANPDKDYEIKILTNDVKYTWDGTLGNTSDSMTGNTKRQGYYNCATGMAITTAGRIYMCNGFSEGEASYNRSDVKTPNQIFNFFGSSPSRIVTLTTEFVATDDKRVFWAGSDSYASNNSMVHALEVSNDANVKFSKGKNYSLAIGGTTFNVVGFANSTKGKISGLAVQKKGDYLFVARALLNQLLVINKTTGAVVKTLTYTSPKGISIDANDDLWMITGGTKVACYVVNSDGSLKTAGLVLNGALRPTSVNISFDGSTVAVMDDSTQTVKAYNSSTGASLWSLGNPGGYTKDVTVDDSKFYTHDLRKNYNTFVVWEPDGSFWVNDPGNYRIQHFTKARAFKDRIMSMGSTYEVYVDPNDPTKVFAGLLEFSVDYSKSLSGTQGWTLKKNWGANVSSIYTARPALIFPTTLSNGRTYAIMARDDRPKNNREVFDLSSTTLMSTGVFRTNNWVLTEDGALQNFSKGVIGGVSSVSRYDFTGFNGNKPTWSSTQEILATTPTLTSDDPNDRITHNVLTSSNKVIFWNPDAYLKVTAPTIAYTGYHLGSINRGGNKWQWRTEKGTHINYRGDYPKAGFFDVGNSVHNNAGGTLSIFEKNIVTSYHGEFWQNTQTNKFNHYYDNGLALGQFGVVKGETIGNSPYGFAGNALTPMIVKDLKDSNAFYLYHGDESTHSGIHRWHITGLNSIEELTVDIPFPGSFQAPTPDYVDLMANLPFGVKLKDNTAGWKRSPVKNYKENSKINTWSVTTSEQTYNDLNSNDVTIRFHSSTARKNTVTRDLGNNNVTNSWKISGELVYPSGNNANGYKSKQFIEVLDASGKIITSFYIDGLSVKKTEIYGNNAVIASQAGVSVIQNKVSKLLNFEMSVVNNQATFTFADYKSVTTRLLDATANWQSPRSLRITFMNTGNLGTDERFQTVALKDFKFYKDYDSTSKINQPPVADAGPDQSMALPINSTNLAGSGTDSDGSIKSYAWTQVSGPSVSIISAASTANALVKSLLLGTYVFKLTVTDDQGATGSDLVKISVQPLVPAPQQNQTPVNQPPVANAGNDIVITLPVSIVSLTGKGTDADGSIKKYSWSKISGPSNFKLSSTTSASTDASRLLQGVYAFRLTVTDNRGATAVDEIKVTVNPAVAVKLLPAVNLTNPVNGIEYKYYEGSWKNLPNFAKISPIKTGLTSNFNISIAKSATQYGFVFSGFVSVPSDGQYTFYSASDDGSQLLIDNVVVVTNDGLHGRLEKSGTIGLKAGKHAIKALYFQQGGNNIFIVSYQSAGGIKKAIPASALYRENQLPIAKAGKDQTLQSPVSTVTLAGTASDNDGSVKRIAWTKVSGPGSPKIATPAVATTKISNLIIGTYQFKITVTDNNGAATSDVVKVIVNPSANNKSVANARPDDTMASIFDSITVNVGSSNTASRSAEAVGVSAGSNKVITLPINTVTLNGKVSDPDAVIKSQAWSKVSGPGEYHISNNASETTTISNLVAGKYTFKLSALGKDSSAAADLVYVEVREAAPAVAVHPFSIQHQVFANSLSVYPNPAKDVTHLKIASVKAGSKVSIAVINAAGIRVKYQDLKLSGNQVLHDIDISGLSDGIYIIVVRFDDGTILNSKLVKIKN